MSSEDPKQSEWFAEELQPHEASLRAWLRYRFSSSLDVDDIVQEAFMVTLKARTDDKLRSPKAFLYGTARNLALRSMQTRRARGLDNSLQIDDCELTDEQADVHDAVVRNQELQILTKAIQTLPDRCRQIFTLRKVYGMTQREIAQKLDISPRTVNAQITIGLRKCMAFVEDYCRESSFDETR